MGDPPSRFISSSSAGPGAGGRGSIFFAMDGHRVRIGIVDSGSIVLRYKETGHAVLFIEGEEIEGYLEEVPFHCPRQAYITVTSGCIFSCLYCQVPGLKGGRKSIGEIIDMVQGVRDRVDALSITSGVIDSIEEEEEYVLSVVKELVAFDLPIGVSIYPTRRTPERLHAVGVLEVKFNVETATDELFRKMCPRLDRELIIEVLGRSIALFGKGRVFSNVIIGLGETDEELRMCIQELVGMGVIPVIRPLSPAAALKGYSRPEAGRLRKIATIHDAAIREAGLDPGRAKTMCTACGGCDLVPGRDL